MVVVAVGVGVAVGVAVAVAVAVGVVVGVAVGVAVGVVVVVGVVVGVVVFMKNPKTHQIRVRVPLAILRSLKSEAAKAEPKPIPIGDLVRQFITEGLAKR